MPGLTETRRVTVLFGFVNRHWPNLSEKRRVTVPFDFAIRHSPNLTETRRVTVLFGFVVRHSPGLIETSRVLVTRAGCCYHTVTFSYYPVARETGLVWLRGAWTIGIILYFTWCVTQHPNFLVYFIVTQTFPSTHWRFIHFLRPWGSPQWGRKFGHCFHFASSSSTLIIKNCTLEETVGCFLFFPFFFFFFVCYYSSCLEHRQRAVRFPSVQEGEGSWDWLWRIQQS